jgi:hypothetical protein
MTTNAYRKHRREIDAMYNRAACWLVGVGCVVITLAWARLLIKVLF